MSAEIETTVSGRGAAGRIVLALAVAAPAVIVRLAGVELAPVAAMVVFGAAVLASVALLMWASEAARVDISGSLALAILALVAILPEYAVDIFFAYTAGHDPAYAAYATANMTGANRLLIGVAWPLLVAFAIFAVRRRRVRGERDRVTLAPHRRTEIVFLAAATVYALVIPLTGRLAWYDTLVLGGLFAAYLWRIRGNEEGVEELAGVAATVAAQPAARRRGLVAALFVAAGAIAAKRLTELGKPADWAYEMLFAAPSGHPLAGRSVPLAEVVRHPFVLREEGSSTREKLLAVLSSDHVLYARARGEKGYALIMRHGLRNILLPAITLQFTSFSELFGGAVLTEQVFSYPGLGQATVAAGLGGDVPLLMGIVLCSALFVFTGNLIADALYKLVDPRMRKGGDG